MRRRVRAATALLGATVMLSGCAMPGAPLGSRAVPLGTQAVLHDAAGIERGNAVLYEAREGLMLRVDLTGVTPGPHGIHLHAVGRCDAPDFATAGPHWNPGQRQHGVDNPAGLHGGDLPNIVVDASGSGRLDQRVASMVSPFDVDGVAIVVHAQPDDLRSDPSGNSGARVLCGVFAMPRG